MNIKTDLPVIIGKNLKKGLFAFRDAKHGGFSVCVVWLDEDKDYESGGTFELQDLRKIQTVLHFCDRESVKVTVDVLNKILKDWKESK